MALVTCPTSSIGTTHKLDSRAAARAFPEPVGDNVYFCGYASGDRTARRAGSSADPTATSSSIHRAFARILATGSPSSAACAGVLTHRDDVADHAKFRHAASAASASSIAPTSRRHGIERTFDGDTELAPDLRHRPGARPHPRLVALLHARGMLFTGDHVWATDDETGLEAGRDVCWYSWPEQRKSIAKLMEYRFTAVLPGHGRRFIAPDAEAMRTAIRAAST